MTEIIKVCIDRYLPEDLIEKAYHEAILENPKNKPTGPEAEGLSGIELALISGKKWANGRILKVTFMDGVAKVQAKVEKFAHTWSQFANIKFDFVNYHDAQIRISFNLPGSWSYLGTDALWIPKDEPTMNFGWLDERSSDDEYGRVVVHEFGHALGCIHEHQNPDVNIPWNEDAVYEYYAGPPNNWKKQTTYNNILQKYGDAGTEFTEFDLRSIMLYPIPNKHTIGDYEVGWNMVLSETDKEMIQKMYPFLKSMKKN